MSNSPAPHVWDQFYCFLEVLALGILLGAAFDLYRGIRLQKRLRRGLLFILADAFFCLAAAVVCIAVLVARHFGGVYIYTYAGLAAGFGLYLHVFSRYLLPFWVRFFSLLHRFMMFLGRGLNVVGRACSAPVRGGVHYARKGATTGGAIVQRFWSRIITPWWRS